jgi:hypothetical protein
MPSEIQMFSKGDDAAYEEWVRRNVGYVLVERSGGFMLHQSRCGHLDLTPGQFTLTTNPRRCARSRKALTDFAEQRAGESPALCQSCM